MHKKILPLNLFHVWFFVQYLYSNLLQQHFVFNEDISRKEVRYKYFILSSEMIIMAANAFLLCNS